MQCLFRMGTKQTQNALLDNCLAPYICSFLNATDLFLSRSVCTSWKNIYQYATYWTHIACIRSSFLTKMLSKMKELIHCDVVVFSKGKSWNLIIHPHEKLTYLRVCHSVEKKWKGGKCEIGLMPKLHTLEIDDPGKSPDTISSKFDSFVLKTPNLDNLGVYNVMIPDYCVPSSISKLIMTTKNRSMLKFKVHHFNLKHCTKLLYLRCESSIYQNQRFEIFSHTVRFGYCDSVSHFKFNCVNLQWLYICKWCEFPFFSPRSIEAYKEQHPNLQKLFVTLDLTENTFDLFQSHVKLNRLELVPILTLQEFERIVDKEVCQ